MRSRLSAALLLAVALAPLPALAGLDVEFGAAVRVNDRTDLFFAVSSRYFGQNETVVRRAGTRYTDPDDVAVALFLCRHSGRSMDEIDGLRRRGLSWWDVSVRVGVPVDVWFVPVARDPGPPYGKAYGYWKKQRRNPGYRFAIADVDARNLVAARMLHEYYGVGIDEAMGWRASGRALPMLVHDQYHKRHGASAARGRDDAGPGGNHPGQGKGRAKGHGKR